MVIADTGFWLALANRRDAYHKRSAEILANLHTDLISTWPVVTETCHLLLHRLGPHAQLGFVENMAAGHFMVYSLEETHLPRLATLMKTYIDLPMDLADASLVLLAEELGHGDILSTDERDFRTYRWKRHKPFDNLLLR